MIVNTTIKHVPHLVEGLLTRLRTEVTFDTKKGIKIWLRALGLKAFNALPVGRRIKDRIRRFAFLCLESEDFSSYAIYKVAQSVGFTRKYYFIKTCFHKFYLNKTQGLVDKLDYVTQLSESPRLDFDIDKPETWPIRLRENRQDFLYDQRSAGIISMDTPLDMDIVRGLHNDNQLNTVDLEQPKKVDSISQKSEKYIPPNKREGFIPMVSVMIPKVDEIEVKPLTLGGSKEPIRFFSPTKEESYSSVSDRIIDREFEEFPIYYSSFRSDEIQLKDFELETLEKRDVSVVYTDKIVRYISPYEGLERLAKKLNYWRYALLILSRLPIELVPTMEELIFDGNDWSNDTITHIKTFKKKGIYTLEEKVLSPWFEWLPPLIEILKAKGSTFRRVADQKQYLTTSFGKDLIHHNNDESSD